MPVLAEVSRLIDNVKVGGAKGALAFAATRVGAAPKTIQCDMRGRFPSAALRLGTPDVQAYRQVFERDEYKVRVPHASLIVDAGAHVGLATLYFAERHPMARILALEPEQDNFELLRRNTAHLDRVLSVRGALYGPGRPVRINTSQGETWTHRVEAATAEDPTSVCGYTLRQVLEMSGAERIDILKLDIEGAEKDVLDGAASDGTLEKVDTILAELHDRIVPGCSRVFFTATAGFQSEWRAGEIVGVSRLSGVRPR